MRFLDKYVSHAVGNHYFMQWSKSNRTKTFLDKVTARYRLLSLSQYTCIGLVTEAGI
jgi:hypothetical protein